MNRKISLVDFVAAILRTRHADVGPCRFWMLPGMAVVAAMLLVGLGTLWCCGKWWPIPKENMRSYQ